VPGAALPAPANAASPAPPSRRSRWPLWLGIAAGTVAVGIAVGITVAYTTPHDADVPATGLGNIDVSLH
jgi:hypothetical protein